MKIKFKAENVCYKNEAEHQRVAYLDILPSVTYRHITWKLGQEYNLYLSWLAWCVSITLISNKK